MRIYLLETLKDQLKVTLDSNILYFQSSILITREVFASMRRKWAEDRETKLFYSFNSWRYMTKWYSVSYHCDHLLYDNFSYCFVSHDNCDLTIHKCVVLINLNQYCILNTHSASLRWINIRFFWYFKFSTIILLKIHFSFNKTLTFNK